MRHSGIGLWMTCAAVAALLAGAAAAQTGNRGMIAIDDGNQRYAMSYAEPDLEAILQPYIARNDVPTFEKYLTLSEAQKSAVERLITAYLEDFQQLIHDKHPAPHEAREENRGPMVALVDPRQRQAPKDNGGGDGADVDDDGNRARPEDRMVNVQDILAEELKADGVIKESLDELPVSPGIAIGISVDGDPESGEPPTPTVDVSISFGGEDDSLDESLRTKLEAAAERAVPRIAEVIREQAMTDMVERMAGIHEGRSPADEIAARFDELEVLRERVAEFQKEADLLLQRLFANVKRLLSEAQIEQWPGFERAFRRIKTLPWGQLDGESTDLLAVVDDLELEESKVAALGEHLKAYELAMDAALKRRNDLLEEADVLIDRSLYIGEYEAAQTIADRVGAARLAVRDLNDRTIDQMSSHLGGRPGDRLKREALADAYPRIYRQTIGQEAFDDVIMMQDIDPELLSLALELAGQHEQRMSNVNERLYRSVRREQENDVLHGITRTIANLQNRDALEDLQDDDTQTAIAKAFQERRDLDARYMKMLYDILPEQMVVTLPAIPKHKVGEEVAAEHRERPDLIEFE